MKFGALGSAGELFIREVERNVEEVEEFTGMVNLNVTVSTHFSSFYIISLIKRL